MGCVGRRPDSNRASSAIAGGPGIHHIPVARAELQLSPPPRANHPYKTSGAATALPPPVHSPTPHLLCPSPAAEKGHESKHASSGALVRGGGRQTGIDGQLPGGGGGGGADPAPGRRPHGARLLGALGRRRHGRQPGPLRRGRHRHHAAGRIGLRPREAPQAAPPRRHAPARPRLPPRQLRRGAEGVRVEAARQAEPRHDQGQGRGRGGGEAGGQAPPPACQRRRRPPCRRRRAQGVRPVPRQGHAPDGGGGGGAGAGAGGRHVVVLRWPRRHQPRPRRRRPRRGAGGAAAARGAARTPRRPAMEARAAEHRRRVTVRGRPVGEQPSSEQVIHRMPLARLTAYCKISEYVVRNLL